MHIALPIGDDNVLMASDVAESRGQRLVLGNNVYVSVHPESRDEADRIFGRKEAEPRGGKALREGSAREGRNGRQTWPSA